MSAQKPIVIRLGFGSPPMAEQVPDLDMVDARQYDRDSMAISRLHVRGFITSSERDRASARLLRDIGAKVAAVKAEGRS